MTYRSARLLNYPLMERQDLTQGQLGSFKFTPVDSIENGHQTALLTDLAQRQMAFELEQAALPIIATQVARNPHKPTPVISDSVRGQQMCPEATFDPAFFNRHIKPDLCHSRLRMGPAALRSAVESAATSPQKVHSPESRNLQFTTSYLHQPASSDMNPVASTFTPSVPISDHGFEDATATNQSVCRALAAEQQAHHATKLALEDVLLRLQQTEIDVKRITKQNRSLVSSVNMLGSIIKHNINHIGEDRQPQSSSKPVKESDVVKSFYEEKLDNQGSILYDALARQRAVYEKQSYPPTDAGSIPSSVHMKSSANIVDSEIFNLELLQSPEPAGSPASGKVFLEPFETQAGQTGQVASQQVNNNKLIDVSPVQVVSSKHPTHAIANPAVELSQDVSACMEELIIKMRGLQTADTPTLELPASFLAKYQTRGKQGDPESDSSEAEGPPNNPTLPPVNDEEKRPNDEKFPARSSSRIRCLVKPQQFELNIDWHVTRENPVYAITAGVTSGHKQESFRDSRSVFWRHPVRYIEYAEKDIFRTVMIDFIPVGSSYKDVLTQVSGGSIETFQLFGPINESTDFLTARVVFNYELGASQTTKHSQEHGLVVNGSRVRVWQVPTQTYPKNQQLEKDVFVNCYTRMLMIDNVNQEALDSLGDKLAYLKNEIVEIGYAHDDLPLVEFTSVAAAAKALRQLISDPDFRGGIFDFDEDPCATPYSSQYGCSSFKA